MVLTQFVHHNRYLIRIMPILIGLLMMCNLYPQDPLKIVPLGNSITQAKTTSPGANSYRRNLWNKLINAGHSVDFVGSLNTDDLESSFPDASFDHDHEGHWGWRADQIVTYLAGWLAGYTPDVALLHIGTNDAYQNNTVASTIEEIEDIIGILRNDNSNVTIFLAQILPLQDVAKNARVDGINAELVNLASSLNQTQSRIILVDHNSGWNITEYTYDNVHPNETGEEIMAQRWFNAFDVFYSSNEPPEITGQNTLSVDEDKHITLTVSDFVIDDPDTDSDDLTLTVSGGSNYSVSGTTVTPGYNWYGTLSVQVTVNDGTSDSEPFDATVTVEPINDAPYISDQSEIAVSEGNSIELTLSHFTVHDVDNPSGPFILTVQSGTDYSLDGNLVIPTFQFNGTLNVPVIISDGSTASNPYNALVTVTEVDDPPVINGQNSLNTDEDHTLTLTLSDFVIDDPDTDPDDLTLTVSGGSNYSVSGTTITSDLNWNGNLSVPVYAFDGTTTSNTFNASVWIKAVNDAPVVTDIPDQTIDRSGSFEIIKLGNYVIDDETPDNNMIWTVGGVLNLAIEITDQEATISSVDDSWSGTELVVFTATDDHPTGPLSNSDEVKFTINVPAAVAHAAVETIKLYPNPANGFVNLVFETDPSQNTVIEITSINGLVVLKETIQSAGRNPYRLNIDHLISGTYTVRIVTDDKSNEIVLIKN